MTDEEDPWFGVGPRDACVRVGTTRYYVKVVRRGGRLIDQGLGAPADEVSTAVVLGAAAIWWVSSKVPDSPVHAAARRLGSSAPGRAAGRLVARAQHVRGWKIGVIRQGGDRWGPTGPTEVVHVETLPPGPFPEARVAGLAEAARAGRFAEGRRRWGRNPTSD